MEIFRNLNYAQQGFLPLVKTGVNLFSCLAIAKIAQSLASAAYAGYKISECKSVVQSPVCVGYSGVFFVSNVILIVAA